MNGTALRKPTAGGWWAWWRHRHHRLGIALFKQSHLGNDSISALNMRLAELLGISLGTQNLCTNILFFLLEFWFGRKYIGLAPSSTASASGTSSRRSMTHSRPLRRRAVAGGAVGVGHRGGAGHGAGRFALPDRRPRHRALRLPFPRSAGLHTLPVLRVPHLHRCAQRPAVLAAGWPCGLGTLICAFCLGPFIQFFDRTFSQKVLQYKPNN